MITSWKTTVGGLLSGGGLLFTQFFPHWATWGTFTAALGSMMLGMAARDNNVTSVQSGAQARADALDAKQAWRGEGAPFTPTEVEAWKNLK